jgi:hypothetical protein
MVKPPFLRAAQRAAGCLTDIERYDGAAMLHRCKKGEIGIKGSGSLPLERVLKRFVPQIA